MSVHKFSALPKDAVYFEAWVLADIDVGCHSFFSNRKELSAVMDSNATNTISVIAVISLFLFGIKIEGLELVTSNVDD